jgi:hypothetical protein
MKGVAKGGAGRQTGEGTNTSSTNSESTHKMDRRGEAGYSESTIYVVLVCIPHYLKGIFH